MNRALFRRVLTSGDKGVAALRQDFHEVVGQVPACQVQAHDGVWQGVALVDRHVVGDAVPRVKHDPCGAVTHGSSPSSPRNHCKHLCHIPLGLTCGTSGGIEGQNGLNSYIHGWHIECLEHNLKCN